MMLINYINIALKKSIGHTKVLFGLNSPPSLSITLEITVFKTSF